MKIIDKKNIKNILIIRLSSLGDVLLTTPLINLLRKELNYAKIDFITSQQFSDILRFNPHIDKLFLYKKSFEKQDKSKFLSSITKCVPKYDLVIDLQDNRHSKFLRGHLGSNIRIINKKRLEKLLLVNFKINLFGKENSIVNNYISTVSDILEVNDTHGLELWLDGEVQYKEQSQVRKISKVGIAPGSQHFTKRWLPVRFGELAKLMKDNYNSEIHVFGIAEEKPYADIISEFVEITDHTGKYDIQGTAKKIDEMDLFITNDTGLMHVAVARKIPTITIWGSSVKEFGFAPYKTPHLIIENNDISCRPCSHIGKSKCPKKHFYCMKEITTEKVFKILINFVEKVK